MLYLVCRLLLKWFHLVTQAALLVDTGTAPDLKVCMALGAGSSCLDSVDQETQGAEAGGEEGGVFQQHGSAERQRCLN